MIRAAPSGYARDEEGGGEIGEKTYVKNGPK